MTAPGETLDQLRTRIDEIDRHIVELLHRRADLAIRVGQLKQQLGLPGHIPEREAAVLQRVASLQGGPMPGRALEAIFRTIMQESLRLE